MSKIAFANAAFAQKYGQCLNVRFKDFHELVLASPKRQNNANASLQS